MMTTNGKKYKAEAYSLTDEYTATINAHAKDSGMNRSEALRDIIDQWVRDRAQEASVATGGGMLSAPRPEGDG